MKIDFKGLLEGLSNTLFVKEEVEKIAKYRTEICEGCQYHSSNMINRGIQITRKDKHCTDCACNIYLKTRALSAQCPLGSKGSHFPNELSKWPRYTESEDESNKILNSEEVKKQLDKYKVELSQNKINEHGSS